MSTAPLVTIVMPVHNDEDWISSSLDSCLAQTLSQIEVICIDDASTDETPSIIASYAARDPRVRLIRQPTNQSAFQARRAGIQAASARYVLFLDGDDELAPNAARRALDVAHSKKADVVGFGVEVVVPEGRQVGRFASDLQPRHKQMLGENIVSELFPVGQVAQGHLWRYLWDVRLLRGAYDALPADLALYRANDIPIAFLALAAATKYASVPDRLYRYYWRRGVSGRVVEDAATFDFYLGAMDSIEAIAPGVDAIAARRQDSATLMDCYRSARLSIIQMILQYCTRIDDEQLQAACLERLRQRAGRTDVIRAAALFAPAVLGVLARHRAAPDESGPVKRVMITAGNLFSGGAQGVVVSQARYLREAGFEVVIGLRDSRGIVHEVPQDIAVIGFDGATIDDRLQRYEEAIREHSIDLVIDHWILYQEEWPFFALVAEALGTPTIGWIHNFALRPIFDFNTRSSFLHAYLPLLSQTVVLSHSDVVFWKMRGVDHVVYLPNPPSPWLLDHRPLDSPRAAPVDRPIHLVWWGRLQQHTKRVRDLVEVAAVLRGLQVPFQLTIIGPDSGDLKARDLDALAEARGVGDNITLAGPLHGEDLSAVLLDADVYVLTSAIEGYPLTLIEAQATGLPVAMYAMPWLAVAENNAGISTAPQSDVHELAHRVAELAADPSEYVRASEGSLSAARAALDHDFVDLYTRLIEGRLPAEFSPEPTLEEATKLFELSLFFAEESIGREKRYVDRLVADLAAEKHLRAQRNEHAAVQAIRPAGRLVLRKLPGLRPLARRVNRFLRRL